MKVRVQVRAQVKEFLEKLAPEPRRRLRLAMQALAAGQGDCVALKEQLSGYHRLRVGGYRIIYRHLPGRVTECVFAEERSLVYQLFEREMLERLRHEESSPPARGEYAAEEPAAPYRAPRRRRPKRAKE